MLRCSQGLEFILDTLKEHVTVLICISCIFISLGYLFVCVFIYLFLRIFFFIFICENKTGIGDSTLRVVNVKWFKIHV